MQFPIFLAGGNMSPKLINNIVCILVLSTCYLRIYLTLIICSFSFNDLFVYINCTSIFYSRTCSLYTNCTSIFYSRTCSLYTNCTSIFYNLEPGRILSLTENISSFSLVLARGDPQKLHFSWAGKKIFTINIIEFGKRYWQLQERYISIY